MSRCVNFISSEYEVIDGPTHIYWDFWVWLTKYTKICLHTFLSAGPNLILLLLFQLGGRNLGVRNRKDQKILNNRLSGYKSSHIKPACYFTVCIRNATNVCFHCWLIFLLLSWFIVLSLKCHKIVKNACSNLPKLLSSDVLVKLHCESLTDFSEDSKVEKLQTFSAVIQCVIFFYCSMTTVTVKSISYKLKST